MCWRQNGGLPSLLRGLALGAAAAALAGWLLTQSKGGGVGLAASAVVVLAVSPQRLRLLVPTAIAAVLVGPQFRPLTDPFNAGPGFTSAARHGAFTLFWLVAAAIVAGTVYALLDRRIEVSPRVHRVAGIVVGALAVAAAVGAVAAFFASVDHPRRFAADKWAAFKRLPTNEQAQTHFVSLGSNRYDFWRVALHEFADHPLAGIGARGFGPAYLVEGRSTETPARAHSVELDALSELGVPGLLLLVVGLGGPLVVCFRRLRLREPTATAAFAGSAYWIVHASGDWNWTIPALGVPFFVLLGAGAAGAPARCGRWSRGSGPESQSRLPCSRSRRPGSRRASPTRRSRALRRARRTSAGRAGSTRCRCSRTSWRRRPPPLARRRSRRRARPSTSSRARPRRDTSSASPTRGRDGPRTRALSCAPHWRSARALWRSRTRSDASRSVSTLGR